MTGVIGCKDGIGVTDFGFQGFIFSLEVMSFQPQVSARSLKFGF